MTVEAQTEERLTPLSYLDGAKGWVRIVRDAVLHPIPLGGVVVAVAAVAVSVWWSYRNTDHGTRRWEAGGAATETASFRHLVKPSGSGFFSTLMTDLGLREQPTDSAIPPKHMDWTQPHVAAYSVPAPTPPHPHPTLRDLGDHGQARAIDFLEKANAVTEQQAWKRLRDTLTDEGDSNSTKDPFHFDRILVATVSKGADWNPGDRMMWTRVFVQPINFSFAGYTVAATENETVKVTSVEATSARKFSADIGLTIPGVEGPNASLAPSNESTVKTTSEIHAQYEKLGIDIMPEFLRIIRESETGGDVVGNTTVSLAVVTDPYNIRKLAPKEDEKALNDRVEEARNEERAENDEIRLLVTGVHLEEDKVSNEDKPHDPITVLPQAPIPHCPLMARVWMLYEQRLIKDGREYYDESHQTVSLLRDADEKKDVEIMSADDVSPAVWSIKIVSNDGKKGPYPSFVRAHIEDKAPGRELLFTDYGLAVKAVHWFRTQSDGYAGKMQFNYLSEFKKTAGEKAGEMFSLIPVKRTQNECAKDYHPENRGYGPPRNS